MTLPADRHAPGVAATLAAIDAATQPRCALLNCYRPAPGEWCNGEHAQRWQREDFVRVGRYGSLVQRLTVDIPRPLGTGAFPAAFVAKLRKRGALGL